MITLVKETPPIAKNAVKHYSYGPNLNWLFLTRNKGGEKIENRLYWYWKHGEYFDRSIH